MKKFATMLASIAGLAASPALAAPYVNLSLPSGTFGNSSVFCGAASTPDPLASVSGSSVPCSFTDTITFTTPTPYTLASASITTIAVGGIGSYSDINFTQVTLDGVAFTLNQLAGGAFEVGGLANLTIGAGTHVLRIIGTSYGEQVGLDGSYSGTLTFARNTVTSTGIPEPTTWLSMILGFGMIGFASRRRKNIATQAHYQLG